VSYILFSGGFIIWPIILLSIISLAIIIEKSWNLARDIVLPKDLTKDIISQIKKKSLTSSMKEKMAQDSIQGTIFFSLIEEKIKSKTNLRLRAEEIGRFEINRLEKFMTLLGTIASVSPILGLLGTVTGMISIFSNLLALETNSIAPLAGGIAEALVTTAAGLIVAIPSLIFYRSFNRTIENYSLELEEESNKLINYLSRN
jgi:biopolymer transport protein ExbB|tara:strand:- start:1432 stop:2034 length:603 start_codon:yes stop_codon:yes gene_type:complete